MDAADRVVHHEFSTEPDPDLPDYRAEVETRRPALMYLAAQILFHHRRFEDARPRFEALIAEHPRSMEANYAAGLLVDSYLAEGDLQQVREATLRFTINPPGPPTEIDPERFSGTLEGSTFQLAMSHAEGGDNIQAAEAFMAFREEFPGSEFDADALYNAAFYYQQAGKIEQSNAMYEQFVQEYPKDSRSLGLFFRIAANYESAFELDEGRGLLRPSPRAPRCVRDRAGRRPVQPLVPPHRAETPPRGRRGVRSLRGAVSRPEGPRGHLVARW